MTCPHGESTAITDRLYRGVSAHLLYGFEQVMALGSILVIQVSRSKIVARARKGATSKIPVWSVRGSSLRM
jgi:hypothetical protein